MENVKLVVKAVIILVINVLVFLAGLAALGFIDYTITSAICTIAFGAESAIPNIAGWISAISTVGIRVIVKIGNFIIAMKGIEAMER